MPGFAGKPKTKDYVHHRPELGGQDGLPRGALGGLLVAVRLVLRQNVVQLGVDQASVLAEEIVDARVAVHAVSLVAPERSSGKQLGEADLGPTHRGALAGERLAVALVGAPGAVVVADVGHEAGGEVELCLCGLWTVDSGIL